MAAFHRHANDASYDDSYHIAEVAMEHYKELVVQGRAQLNALSTVPSQDAARNLSESLSAVAELSMQVDWTASFSVCN
jgi:hypothetical protein